MFRKALLWSVVAGFFSVTLQGCSAWVDVPVDFSILKTQYPTVKYLTSEDPTWVEFLPTRPAHFVALDELPKHVWGAFIVSEDWNFFGHGGYDLSEIWESFKANIKRGKYARGGSTITQQLSRVLFLEKDKTLWRKVRELSIALALEDGLKKRRILELYLNVVELGEGLYGIGKASKHYFSKSAADLNPKEAAFLAMLLPSPRRYNQSFEKRVLTPYARETIADILDKMVRGKVIDATQRTILEGQKLSFED